MVLTVLSENLQSCCVRKLCMAVASSTSAPGGFLWEGPGGGCLLLGFLVFVFVVCFFFTVFSHFFREDFYSVLCHKVAQHHGWQDKSDFCFFVGFAVFYFFQMGSL